MTAEKERARGSSDRMTGERVKVWAHLGTCLLTGAALSLASSDASAQILKSGSALDSHGSAIVAIAQGGEGGEGSEGAEKGSTASLAKDDVAYLTYLGLVRGHLDIGVDLYREGAQDPAKTHMKHPGDKLYADLAPALERRGAQGFANELEGLAMLVENGAPVSRGRACPSSRARPDRASRGHRLRIRRPRLKTRLETIRNLVRTAAEEYAVALRDEQ